MAPVDAAASLWTELKRLLPVLASLLLLAFVAAFSQPAGAQDACGDGVCDPGETAPACPQDCGGLLLDEDFEDGQAQGWNYDPGRWTTVDDGGSLVWTTSAAGTSYAATGSIAWSETAWFLRVRRVESDVNLYFRSQENLGYGLHLGDDRLILWTERTGSPQDLDDANVALGTTWHDYRIDAIGRQITVTVDSAVVLTYTDGVSASLHGGIGL